MKSYYILKSIKGANGLWHDKIIATVYDKTEAEKLVAELRSTSQTQLYSYMKGLN